MANKVNMFITDNILKTSLLAKKENKLQNLMFILKKVIKFLEKIYTLFLKAILISFFPIGCSLLLMVIGSFLMMFGRMALFLSTFNAMCISSVLFLFTSLTFVTSFSIWTRLDMKLIDIELEIEAVQTVLKIRDAIGEYLRNPSIIHLQTLKDCMITLSTFRNKEIYMKYIDKNLLNILDFISELQFVQNNDQNLSFEQIEKYIVTNYMQHCNNDGSKTLGQKVRKLEK